MAIDWLTIKTEYITTRISLRKLAEKHGASFSTLEKKARKEGWNQERKETGDKIAEKVRQKTVASVATAEADRIVRMLAIGDKLLTKLDEAAEQLGQQTVRNKRKTRTIEYGGDKARGKPTREVTCEVEEIAVALAPIDRLGLQQLTAALKNLHGVVADFRDTEQTEGVIIVDDIPFEDIPEGRD